MAASDPLSRASAAASTHASSSFATGGGGGGGEAAMTSSGGLLYDDDASEEEDRRGQKFVGWSDRKTVIMQTYTTTGSIQMPSFVSREVAQAGRGGNTLKARVDAISEEGDDLVSMVRANAREYVKHMTDLNQELAKAWNAAERVKALKMGIQCSKLLSDSATPQFYPSMFVLVTEILDTFGGLVFERIKEKGLTAAGQRKKRVEEFGPEDVTEEARETCKNWFFKVASIRELLPRVYMECAILRCHQFLTGYSDFPNVLSRLASMMRGIADPMVATFARAYLVRCGMAVNPNLKPYIQICFNDTLDSTSRQLKDDHWSKRLVSQSLDSRAYIELMGPATDYIVHCLGYGLAQGPSLSLLKDYIMRYPLVEVTYSGFRVLGPPVVLTRPSWR